jgi:hypothetical protein
MGIFDFFKRKETEEKVILESELKQYFDALLSEKLTVLEAKLKEQREYAQYKKEKILEAIKELERADLMNKNVVERALQIMQGNKQNYIQRTRGFFQEQALPKQQLDLHRYCKGFFEKLEQLMQSTQKNYFILKEFFDHEVSLITRRIKEYEDIIIQMHDLLEKSNMEALQAIEQDILNLATIRQRRKQIQQEQLGLHDQMDSLEQKKQKTLAHIEQLEQTTDYKAYHGFIDQRNSLEKELKHAKEELSAQFSELDRALKKFSKITTNETLVNAYLVDEVKALDVDEDLQILSVLEQLRKEIDNETLELKDKKKEKSMEAIDTLSKEFLESARKKIRELKDSIADADRKIRHNITITKIKDNQSFLEGLLTEETSVKRKIEYNEAQLESMSLKLAKQKIQQKIQQHLNTTITIK